MKFNVLIILFVFAVKSYGQHNHIGKSKDFIIKKYQYDPEFTVKIDTINKDRMLITCRSFDIYPYYTYEIDMLSERCISYGFVSRNRDILKSQLETLDYIGKLVEIDSSASNFVYEVDLANKKIYYTVRQPFAKSQIKTRRDLYYILVTEEKKKLKIQD